MWHSQKGLTQHRKSLPAVQKQDMNIICFMDQNLSENEMRGISAKKKQRKTSINNKRLLKKKKQNNVNFCVFEVSGCSSTSSSNRDFFKTAKQM